ncbi:MAG: hypothetical protein HC910_19595, partial [Spirulinaceae cyanobacterium SM2_1_0]|nr:hypothetical protein [Spirulinaceae cyanobacterium SM2_1_0]
MSGHGRSRRWRSIQRWVLMAIAAALLALATPAPAWSQWLPQSEAGAGNALPRGVQRIGVIEVATVKSHLDGRDLFEITAPAVQNRNELGDMLPVEVRAQQVTAAIDRAAWRLAEARDPAVVVAELNNFTILQAVDRKQLQRRVQLLTVTSLDADYHGLALEELAAEWQGILQDEIAREIRLYSPDELAKRTLRTLQIFLVAIAISVALWGLQWLLGRYSRRLASQRQREMAAAAAAAAAAAT